MSVFTVKVNDIEIDYAKFGTGEKIFVMIPGLSLKSVMLSAQAVEEAYSLFKDEYTVYLFDRKKNIEAGYSIENMADDTAKAMETLGIENAYAFGASQGGMIAQIIAIKYPHLIKRLVLGSSISKQNKTSLKVISEWTQLADKEDVIALNHSIFTHLYSKELLDSFGDALYELEKDGTAQELKRFSILAKACLGFNSYDDLPKIKCPTLVLGANNDKVLTGEASKEIAEKLNCEIYMYDGEHAIYDEAPDYKQRLWDFFEK